MSSALRDEFLLDPTVVFLNHGSFGACPHPVFEAYQCWQRELERQPVEFLGRRLDSLLATARTALAAYVGTQADNLIFVPNATVGLNTVARSLRLQPGDEILTTNHEYGALDYTWQFISQHTAAVIVRHSIPLPVPSVEAVVEGLWAKVTPRTKVIFMSHITSPTALILPIEPIIQRARHAGILTVIDGAHVPGQLALDLTTLGADFYAGNCHKWLCAPKGSAFLYARPEHQAALEPLVISWGWGMTDDFVGRNQWQGTRDVAAFLSVPAALEFQHQHAWDTVRETCHRLVGQTQQRLTDLTGLPAIAPPTWYRQMMTFAVPVPDPHALQTALYQAYRIEIPGIRWEDKAYLRLSVQGYNTPSELDLLVEAVEQLTH